MIKRVRIYGVFRYKGEVSYWLYSTRKGLQHASKYRHRT